MANYGLALAHSGRNLDAIRVYKQVVRQRPDFVEAYGTLGEACASINDYKSALRVPPPP
jgi:predicted Zn-dependent protease